MHSRPAQCVEGVGFSDSGARLNLPNHMLTVEPDEIMKHLDFSSVISIGGLHLISSFESYLSTAHIQAKSPFRSDKGPSTADLKPKGGKRLPAGQ